MDALKVFEEALSKAREDGYNSAIAEMIDYLSQKSKGEVKGESKTKTVKNTKATPVVSDDHCPDCLTLKTHCSCKGESAICDCGTCDCVATVKREGALCPECRKH